MDGLNGVSGVGGRQYTVNGKTVRSIYMRVRRHAPFGMSTNNLGGTVHRVIRCEGEWLHGQLLSLRGYWECRRRNPYAFVTRLRLLNDPSDHPRCRRCTFDGEPEFQTEPHLYVARCADGLVKVGCSTDLDARMRALDAALLASVPGDFVAERRLLRDLGLEPVRGMEWFAPGSEQAALAALEQVRS